MTYRRSLAGVDGCPAGWLVVRSAEDGRGLTAAVCADFRAVLAACVEVRTIAIDIPIGLADASARPVDVAARAALGPRKSSVFPAPVRGVLAAAEYRDACDRSFAAHGKKLSKQTWFLVDKIREVDRALRDSPADAARVFEVHPEVSFRCWHGEPMAHPKRSADGFAERLALVEAWVSGAYAGIRAAYTRGAVANDDILDAIAALWSAQRIAAGRAESFPAGEPTRDRFGLPMVIRA